MMGVMEEEGFFMVSRRLWVMGVMEEESFLDELSGRRE